MYRFAQKQAGLKIPNRLHYTDIQQANKKGCEIKEK
jgi:hypothetical protein